jgi:hypothetical protein
MIQFITNNKAAILAAALFISEALSLIPSVKANGIFQFLFGWLKNQKPV